jgi:hypothetical protein
LKGLLCFQSTCGCDVTGRAPIQGRASIGRLAQDLAELERAFGDKGITPFADTQPWGQVDQDFEKRMPKAD